MTLRARMVVAVVVVVQLAVPAVLRIVPDELPVQFGWQMYSFDVPSPEFHVQTQDGDEVWHVGQISATRRADVNFIRPGAEHLCSLVEDAVEVEVAVGGRAVEVVSC